MMVLDYKIGEYIEFELNFEELVVKIIWPLRLLKICFVGLSWLLQQKIIVY